MKSRGVYETPGGTILYVAHRAIESITLDKGASHLKDEIMPRYAELIYNGFWFSPEREMLQSLIDKSQSNVNGTVKLKFIKGTLLYWVVNLVQASIHQKWLLLKEMIFTIKKMQRVLLNLTP